MRAQLTCCRSMLSGPTLSIPTGKLIHKGKLRWVSMWKSVLGRCARLGDHMNTLAMVHLLLPAMMWTRTWICIEESCGVEGLLREAILVMPNSTCRFGKGIRLMECVALLTSAAGRPLHIITYMCRNKKWLALLHQTIYTGMDLACR